MTSPALPAVIQPDPMLGQPIALAPSDRLRLLIIDALVGGTIGLSLSFTLAGIPAWYGPVLTILIMAAVALGLGWYTLHVWNREIILYERGFSYREGSNLVFFTYGEVRGVRALSERRAYFGGLLKRGIHHFTVTTKAGDTFRLNNAYRRADKVGWMLAERVDAAIAWDMEARLAKGDAIPFGETLRLTADGWKDGDTRILWSDLGDFHVQGGAIRLLRHDGTLWRAYPLGEVENIGLLVRVLRAGLGRGDSDA